MSMRYYPIYVDLDGRKAVIIGGGRIAERKARTLLECGALVTVIAPDVTDGLQALSDDGAVAWLRRGYQAGDLVGAFCVYAATDDTDVNRSVFEEATRNNQLCNVVDVPPLCNFIVPSIVDRGDLAIAVSTSGNSPALAKHLRRLLEAEYGEEWRMLNDVLGRLRPEMKRRYQDEASRGAVLDRMLDAGILDLLREGRESEAEELAWSVL